MPLSCQISMTFKQSPKFIIDTLRMSFLGFCDLNVTSPRWRIIFERTIGMQMLVTIVSQRPMTAMDLEARTVFVCFQKYHGFLLSTEWLTVMTEFD